jgi:transcription elongation factor GreA
VVPVPSKKKGKSVKYTIVGSAEARPQEHKLSNESPVGRALLGRRRNETVAVKVPRGPARKLKITKIDVGLK